MNKDKITLELDAPEEIVEKKSNFFRDLFKAGSAVSSKRFGGLYLITIFGASQVISLFTTLSDQALELCKTGGWMGLLLLGVNVVPEVVKSVKA